MSDPYAELVKYLAAAGQVVYVELPHDAPLQRLPCIDLQPAGPDVRLGGLNTLGGDLVGIDVDLYIPAAYWKSGKAAQHAQALRHHLSQFRLQSMSVVDVTRPKKLPDRNENIRRLGMTATLAVIA